MIARTTAARRDPRDEHDVREEHDLRDLRDEDLHDLLVEFYERVGRDPYLAPYFAAVDMRAHMPRIVDFWSTLLFHTGRYAGNAFRPHQAMPGLTAEHFSRWLGVLEATVDARFAGPMAEQMKALGHRIAYSMQVRLGIAPAFEYARGEDGATQDAAPGA